MFQIKLTQFLQRNEAMLLRQYRLSKSSEAVARQTMCTVRKCQVVCRQMDDRLGILPPEPWFWPKPPNLSEEDDEVCLITTAQVNWRKFQKKSKIAIQE